MENQIAAMRKLGMTDEEIAQVLQDDKRIDKGEKLFELSKEQQKNVKQAKNIGTHTVYNFQKKERKKDVDKQKIMQCLNEALNQIADNTIEITNIEREIAFLYNNKKYKIVLSCPRT